MKIQNTKGFSLIEVLIALCIFAIGALALAKMQMVSMSGNTTARSITGAATLAEAKLEELRSLPYLHADLTDKDSSGDAGFGAAGLDDEDASADGSETGIVMMGPRYDVFWNVAEDSPVSNCKTIRVIVRRSQPAVKRLTLDGIVSVAD
jgi:prepilin-type N-terminal cleavage/methylation domain-containing protein